MKKTLKEIYNLQFIENPETGLLKHINKILNKTPDELDEDDICVLIRQEMFLDISIPKAVEIIKEDHAAGDNYDYCLLYNLSNIEALLTDYKELIADLIIILEKDFEAISFEFEDEKKDYLESIDRLKSKIA